MHAWQLRSQSIQPILNPANIESTAASPLIQVKRIAPDSKQTIAVALNSVKLYVTCRYVNCSLKTVLSFHSNAHT